jgi:hypothetical protein
MPRKTKIEDLFRKNLGKKTADALLAEIDKMIRENKSAARIEKMIMARISAHIEDRIVAKIGPIDPSATSRVRVGVHSELKPMVSVFNGMFVPLVRVGK